MSPTKNRVMVAILFSAAVLPLFAQVWEYLYDPPTTNYVASGTETLASRLVVGNDQRVYKDGAGTWVLPENLIDVFWPVTLKGVAGSLQIGVGADAGSDPGAFTLPTSITDKALLWVDAADPQASHLVGTGNEVTYWYDRREGASVSSPKHYYAYADPTYATGGSPVKGSYDGRDGVYFGGLKSNKLMIWYLPNGTKASFETTANTRIAHFFAVHGVSNSWGCIYGSYDGNGSSWITGGQSCSDLSTSTAKYFWNNEFPHAVSGRAYLNGERLDPLQNVQRGVQLLDTTSPEAQSFKGSATAFFTDRNNTNRNSGDYLFEAICFTNVLTEAELQQVRGYLMRKWQIAGRKDVQVKLAGGAALVADTTSGVATNGANIAGVGTLAKKGANDLVYRNLSGQAYEGVANGAQSVNTGTRFDGEIDVQAGKVEMLSQAAIAAAAGKRISSAAAIDSTRPKVSVASAAAGVLAKDGAGDVLVNGVPSGTQRLCVEAGRLEVRNVASASALDNGGSFEVFVANHSFEEGTDADFGDGATNVLKAGRYGWYVASNGDAKLIHFSKWGIGKSKVMDNTTRYNWKFYSDAPDGDGVLCISSGKYAETPVTIPSPGWYELSFRAAGREAYPSSSDTGHAYLVGPAGTLAFGRYLYYLSANGDLNYGRTSDYVFAKQQGYQRVVFRQYVPQAGEYRLRLAADSTTGCFTKLVDDVHLRRIADAPADIAYLPNGTFEEAALIACTDGTARQIVTNATTVAGWTLHQPSDWTETHAAVAFVTPMMNIQYGVGSAFNDSRGPGHGFVQMLFRAPSTSATTTFTSTTSGTFRVQADLAVFYCAGASLQLTATVNGTDHDLGTITPDHKMMRTRQWPNRLTLAVGDSVTMTFTFTRTTSNAGLWMDDVGLTTRCVPVEGNLVKNGSFEKWSNSYTFSNWKTAQGQVLLGDTETTDAGGIKAFGRERVDGRYFIRFSRNSSGGTQPLSVFYQDVAFPQEGVYRLSFYSHKRLNSGTSLNNTAPTIWWLADTTAQTTNRLIRTANDTNKYTEHTVDFYVPRKGTFRLGITADQLNTKTWHDAMIDAVSVTHIGDLRPTDAFDKDMQIEVAAGAKLAVCFEGSVPVARMKLGNRHVHGTVNATTHPDYIVGTGSFEIPDCGLMIIVR